MKQVSVGVKTAYGLGVSLLSVKNMLFHFFFLYFFANVLGVSELLIVAATMIALIVDAFTDPVMGQISDNARSERWGRRHKFMLIGILPTMLALYLLFAPPMGLSQMALFFWMLGFLLVVRIGLTVYGVPYMSLGAELSTDYDERTVIMTVREFFNNAFAISVFVVGLLIFLPETPAFEDGMMNRAGYAPFVMTMAIIGGVGALIATFGTKRKIPELRRYSNDERTHWTQTLSQLKLAASIRPFLWLCAGYCLILILYGAASALSFYVAGYLWQLTQVQKFLIAFAPMAMLVIAPFLVSVLAKRLDKKAAICVFAVLYFTCGALPYLLYLLDLAPAIGTAALFHFVLAFHCLAFTGLFGVLVIANSMLADLVDVMELKTGKRQEGVLSAAFSFAQKMTFIFGTMIASLCLIAIKFPKQTEPSLVPQATIDGLAFASIIIGITFTALGVWSFLKYGLNRADLAAIKAQIEPKRLE